MTGKLVPLVGSFKDETIALDGRRLRCVVDRVTFTYAGGDFEIESLYGTFCIRSDVPQHPNVQRLSQALKMPVHPLRPPAIFHVVGEGTTNLSMVDCIFETDGDIVAADSSVNLVVEGVQVRPPESEG